MDLFILLKSPLVIVYFFQFLRISYNDFSMVKKNLLPDLSKVTIFHRHYIGTPVFIILQLFSFAISHPSPTHLNQTLSDFSYKFLRFLQISTREFFFKGGGYISFLLPSPHNQMCCSNTFPAGADVSPAGRR